MTARTLKFVTFVAVLTTVALAAFTHQSYLKSLALEVVERSRGAGPLGVVLYSFVYISSSVLLLPASVLTVGAGYAWGPVWGVVIVSPTSVLAATAALVLGRTLARAQVEARFANDPRVQAIDRAISANGFKVVLLLRLSPVLPFNLLNYGLSLTRVNLRDYVLASALGMFPATVLYVYLGSMMSSASELVAGPRQALANNPAGSALYWGGLVATAAVVWWVTRLARTTLHDVLKAHTE